MSYVTNPIRNEKQQLAFRGIIIKENYRQSRIIDAMTNLAKTFKEIEGARLVDEGNNR